jgi:hypothetical protein
MCQYGPGSAFIPVKKGDTVSVLVDNTPAEVTKNGCWFVPPVEEPVPLPPNFTPSDEPGYFSMQGDGRVKLNADLSTAERLAGYKDDRGKEVYIRTFRGNLPAQGANAAAYMPLDPALAGYDGHIVRQHGEYQRLDQANKPRFPIPHYWPSHYGLHAEWDAAAGLRMFCQYGYAITNPAQHPYAVTVEYTKE